MGWDYILSFWDGVGGTCTECFGQDEVRQTALTPWLGVPGFSPSTAHLTTRYLSAEYFCQDNGNGGGTISATEDRRSGLITSLGGVLGVPDDGSGNQWMQGAGLFANPLAVHIVLSDTVMEDWTDDPATNPDALLVQRITLSNPWTITDALAMWKDLYGVNDIRKVLDLTVNPGNTLAKRQLNLGWKAFTQAKYSDGSDLAYFGTLSTLPSGSWWDVWRDDQGLTGSPGGIVLPPASNSGDWLKTFSDLAPGPYGKGRWEVGGSDSGTISGQGAWLRRNCAFACIRRCDFTGYSADNQVSSGPIFDRIIQSPFFDQDEDLTPVDIDEMTYQFGLQDVQEQQVEAFWQCIESGGLCHCLAGPDFGCP